MEFDHWGRVRDSHQFVTEIIRYLSEEKSMKKN